MVEFIAIFNHSFFCNSAGDDLVNYSNVYVLHFYCLSMDWSKELFSWWYVASNCLLLFTRFITFLGKCRSARGLGQVASGLLRAIGLSGIT